MRRLYVAPNKDIVGAGAKRTHDLRLVATPAVVVTTYAARANDRHRDVSAASGNREKLQVWHGCANNDLVLRLDGKIPSTIFSHLRVVDRPAREPSKYPRIWPKTRL